MILVSNRLIYAKMFDFVTEDILLKDYFVFLRYLCDTGKLLQEIELT